MQQDYITYIVAGLVVFAALLAAYVYVVRMTISLKRQLWNQKQMVKLLCIIAKRLGEDPGKYISVVEEKLEVPDDQL